MKSLRILPILVLFLLMPVLSGAQPSESPQSHAGRMQWWREARFGMFVHWGLYAIPAGAWEGKTDYGEWIRNNAHIPLEVYDTLTAHFNPVRFDAREWVRMAKNAGMRYVVLTSKHHDGFALFDSHVSDFDVMSTPFRRDIVGELAEACRNQGIAFGLYYSIMDWHHPDYLPRRSWEKNRSAQGADYDRYVAYMKAQLKELLTNYGPIGILWFDGEWESTWTEERGNDMYAFVRSLQPDIIINNRVGAKLKVGPAMKVDSRRGGDFGTPEQRVPATGIPGVDWESCMTMNENWGYNKADKNFKSSRELVRTLVDIASKGGNYLLNVGPTATGEFPEESVERLRTIGEWMSVNGESIYGTTASPFIELGWGRCTLKAGPRHSLLYLHVFDWPSDGQLHVPGLMSEPVRAYLLADPTSKDLDISRFEDAVRIRLPATPPSNVDAVVVLEVRGLPDVIHPPIISAEHSIFVDSVTIDITGNREDVEIRYTLNGDIPSARSARTDGREVLFGSADVTARFFRMGKPVSGVSTASFIKVGPHAAVSVEDAAPGISYTYYEGDWDVLPDFRLLSPLKSGTLPDVTFGPRLHDEHFGFLYVGYISAPATGVYSFSTISDDGSRLWVDDSLVVDNDGLHGMRQRTGEIALATGLHSLRISYFEKTGGEGLRILWATPGETMSQIPASRFYSSR